MRVVREKGMKSGKRRLRREVGSEKTREEEGMGLE